LSRLPTADRFCLRPKIGYFKGAFSDPFEWAGLFDADSEAEPEIR
jgi:hypothetical protein